MPVPPVPRQVARVSTILIVDDEDDIVRSLTALLQSSLPNTRCLGAAGGEEALRLLQSNPIDLILSDYKMPGMNGLEFLDRARAMAPRVTRMLLTAFPDLDVAMHAINEAGIEMFFTKPVEADRIVRVVRESLASRRAREDRDHAMGRALSMKKVQGA